MEENEEKNKIRHTINAEETFTLAKDVFDIRCFIKNVYANRAVIARRVNVITLSISAVFTLLYCAYLIFSGLYSKLSLDLGITAIVLVSAYAAFVLILLIIFICSFRAKAKNVRRFSRALAVFRLLTRLISVVVSVLAIALTVIGGSYAAANIAVDIIIVLLSVFTLVMQLFPLIFGGLAKFVRWLLSPVKIKHRFSVVALEWYELSSEKSDKKSDKKEKPSKGHRVHRKYRDKVGELLDKSLLPALGQEYVFKIKPARILEYVDGVPEEDKFLAEGVLKSVFAYAAECGYVAFDPCRDLSFEGDIEKKPRKTIKERLFGVGLKLGKSALDKYITGSTEEE